VVSLLEGISKVLVIDDDSKMCELVSSVLDPFGFEVLRAYDGKEGLQMVLTERPDLIILDLIMPEMNGFEVLERIREEPSLRNIPVFIITGKELDQSEKKRLTGQITSLIEKGDFSKEKLVAEVSRLINFHKANESSPYLGSGIFKPEYFQRHFQRIRSYVAKCGKPFALLELKFTMTEKLGLELACQVINILKRQGYSNELATIDDSQKKIFLIQTDFEPANATPALEILNKIAASREMLNLVGSNTYIDVRLLCYPQDQKILERYFH
jgi:CheY-like chemotaxis protein